MKRVIREMVILLLAVFMLFGCTDPVEFPEDNKETPAVPVEPEVKPEPEPEVKPEPTPDPDVNPEPEVKPDPEPEPEPERPKLTVDDFPAWLKDTTWKINMTIYLDDEKLETQESVGKLPSELFSLEKYGFSGNAVGTAKATETTYDADLEEDLTFNASDGSLKTQHVELVAAYTRDGKTCNGSTTLTQTDNDGSISRVVIEYVLVEVEVAGV